VRSIVLPDGFVWLEFVGDTTHTMNHSRNFILLCSAVCLGITLVGCASREEYAAKRRQRLLALYPPGTTTRADVQNRWGKPPELSETRPASGWGGFAHPAVRVHAVASEQRTGKTVHRCERYFGPDGWSGGLCYCWYYYDDRDCIVDAEWQWHTD
jgi:hypothetical protein